MWEVEEGAMTTVHSLCVALSTGNSLQAHRIDGLDVIVMGAQVGRLEAIIVQLVSHSRFESPDNIR